METSIVSPANFSSPADKAVQNLSSSPADKITQNLSANFSTNLPTNPPETDRSLHQKFVQLGADRRKLTNELLALLPEIFEKQIYKKYTATIVEYAGKFGGLSKGVVVKRLRLEKYLSDKPILREAIRTEGVHKVALVAPLATAETEKAWVDKVKNMSKGALQELSKEMRRNLTPGVGLLADAENYASIPGVGAEKERISAPCRAVPMKITVGLDEEMTFRFLKLKKKFGENLGNKEVMAKIFEVAEGEASERKTGGRKAVACGTSERKIGGREVTTEIPEATECATEEQKTHNQKKSKIQKSIPGDAFAKIQKNISSSKKPDFVGNENPSENISTRYIPARKRKTAIQKTNDKCSYPNCNRPSEILHHIDRFAANYSHKNIKPLCRIHHEFAHNGLIAHETADAKNWRLNIKGGNMTIFDIFYRSVRRKSL